MVAPEITTHIWNCNNLAQINTDLVSILYQNFTPTALFPTPSFVLLLSYKLDLYTLYAHQHRFIIVLCSCLLNQMGEKKRSYKENNIFIIFYIYRYSCLYQCFLCLLCWFELLHSVLSFQAEGLFFVLCRTHLFIFVYLGIS